MRANHGFVGSVIHAASRARRAIPGSGCTGDSPVRKRGGTGFFFAPGGFAKTFEAARQQHATSKTLVIPVDADDLERWIEADDRLAVVNDLQKRTVFSRRA